MERPIRAIVTEEGFIMPRAVDHNSVMEGVQSVEPMCLRVPAACRFVGIGRSRLYELIAAGDVEIVKLGSSTLVLTESLRALINARRTGSVPDA
jgi:predicted DNA-binding transcriptional regulator AlpA